MDYVEPEPAILAREITVADMLDVSIAQVRAGRQGKGPLADLPFVKMGRSVRYDRRDVEEFVRRSRVQATSLE